MRPSEITIAAVEAYKARKLAKRAAGGRLGNRRSTRRCGFAHMLDDAVELVYVDSNAAPGRKRRLKAAKPRRTWLEVDELRALVDAAGAHRASSRRWRSPSCG